MSEALICRLFPLQVFWIIPFEWLHWTLIVIAILISGSVLVLTFWPVVHDDTKVVAVATVATIVVLHTLLAIGCKVGESAKGCLVSVVHRLKTKLSFFFSSFSAVLLPDSRLRAGTRSHSPPSSHTFPHQTLITTGTAWIWGGSVS